MTLKLLQLREKVERLELFENEVRAARSQIFPINSVVKVNHSRYQGFGIICSHAPDTRDQVEAVLEHGEGRYYPISSVEPATDQSEWPAWILRIKRSRAAKKAAITRAQNKIKDRFRPAATGH